MRFALEVAQRRGQTPVEIDLARLMLVVDCIIEDPRWDALTLDALAQTAAQAALTAVPLPEGAYEIALLACDDAKIQTLNASFRAKDAPTNVLSWPSNVFDPQDDGAAPDLSSIEDPMLGDLALSFETCAKEANASNISLADHTTHLIVHGTLHLLGFDHIRDGDAARMESLERQILGNLGLPDPYYR